MRRPVVIAAGVIALVVSALLIWVDIGRARQYERLLASGDAALGAGQYVLAVEAFSGALTVRPDSMLAHLRRGDTYRRQGQLEAARRDLLRAAGLDQTAPQPLALLGDVAIAQGRHQDAIEYYRRELSLDDRDERVLYKLALALFDAGRPEDALDAVRRTLALDDGVVEAHHLLGVILHAMGRTADAVAPLTRALSIDATFAPARETLALVYEAAGRRREGLDQLEALAALETGPGPLVELGLAYARMGRLDAAALTLERAAARAPGDVAVRLTLSRIWLQLADPGADRAAAARALEMLRPLAESGQASTEALALYGWALLLSGRTAEAERTLQQAAIGLPVDPLAFRHLARAAIRLGHVDVAREAERRYAALTGH